MHEMFARLSLAILTSQTRDIRPIVPLPRATGFISSGDNVVLLAIACAATIPSACTSKVAVKHLGSPLVTAIKISPQSSLSES